jgi:hypothetical protein
MIDPRPSLTDHELEQRLQDLALHVALPTADDLARRVRAALQVEGADTWPRPSRHASWRIRRGRRVLIVLAACLAILALVVAASPVARATIARLFAIPGVSISRAPQGRLALSPVGAKLDLGARTTLAAAQRHTRFTIELPHYQSIAQPDEVYINGPLPGQISLVYRARAGLPRAAHTGVGLLITEFRAALELGVLKKVASMGSRVENVQFGGARGVWLSGAPHFFAYATGDDNVIVEPFRLADNGLLWERGGITYRLEGSMSEAVALRIAESMR